MTLSFFFYSFISSAGDFQEYGSEVDRRKTLGSISELQEGLQGGGTAWNWTDEFHPQSKVQVQLSKLHWFEHEGALLGTLNATHIAGLYLPQEPEQFLTWNPQSEAKYKSNGFSVRSMHASGVEIVEEGGDEEIEPRQDVPQLLLKELGNFDPISPRLSPRN